MNLTLRVHPGAVWSWEEFQRAPVGHRVALDGIVSGPTIFTYNAPARSWIMNFNHSAHPPTFPEFLVKFALNMGERGTYKGGKVSN